MCRAHRAARAFIVIVFLGLMVCHGKALAAPPDAQTETLGQVAGILDYIGGDYRGAVGPDGAILDAGEYAEQRALAEDARGLLAKVGIDGSDPVQQRLTELSAALAERRPPAVVTQLCHAARTAIVRDHGVDLAPTKTPSRSEAEQLFRAQACNTCHGDDGSAQTPTALTLNPRPANFLDAERMAMVSPHRAFHAISHGVPGTAMVAYPQLSEQQRWSLAFYVLSLRHVNGNLSHGQALLAEQKTPLPTDARGLAELSNEELDQRLAESIPDAGARADALAYLRATAPFASASAANGSMAVAFERLAYGLEAYRKDERDAARRAFISAYLDGVEPHEAGLRSREPELVAELEKAMLSLRLAAASGAPVTQVEELVAEARTLLRRAEHSKADASAAFVGAFTIALREGLEIVLLIAALIGLVRKRGQADLVKWVHAGWLLAIPAGLLTYVGAESVLGGMQRELAEGLASLLAAVVLLGVTHWLLGQLSAKRWVQFLSRKIGTAVSSPRAALAVLAMSFVAAYREAFEIVLFLQALVRDAGAARQVWLGALTGLAALCAIALVLLRIGQRLKPAPFMLASSICLAVLAFLLVGKGVHALQEAAVVPLTPLPVRDLPWLGIYGSAESLGAQGLLVVALLASALWPRFTAKREAERTDKAVAK